MERRVRRSLVRTGAAVFIAFVFMVCSNPIDIVDKVTTEVKAANNKFLLIKSVGPAINTTNVNPGLPLTIMFDRDVDLTDFAKSIAITPTVTFKPPSYNQATKTLSIEPDPFLKDNTLYTVTITKTLRGSDGSDLQNEYIWAFTTGEYPTVSVQISDANYDKLTLTNNDAHPILYIKSNLAAKVIRLGRSESDCLSKGWQDIPSTEWKIPDASALPNPFTLDPADGQRAVYVQVAKDDGSSMSLVKFDTVLMDKTPPTLALPLQQRWVNEANTTTPSPYTVNEPNGIKSYAWSSPSPYVGIDNGSTAYPTLSVPGAGPADGDYTVNLTLVDNANNAALFPLTLTRDTVHPSVAPVLVTPTTPTASAFPRWTWTKGVGSTGGETTPIYRAVLDGGTVVRDKSTYTYYVPPDRPPRATGLADGVHTLVVYETDNAGNLSPASITSTVTVSVLPKDGSTLTSFTPTFQWHTMWDREGIPSKYYIFHISNVLGGKDIWADKLAPQENDEEVQSLVIPEKLLVEFAGEVLYWYVDNPDQGLRTPEKYAWSFRDYK